MKKYIFMNLLVVLFSAITQAHVGREDHFRHLKGAQFILQQDINLPPGETKYIVSSRPGELLSYREKAQEVRNFNKQAKDSDLHLEVSVSIVKYDDRSSSSVDILLEKNLANGIETYYSNGTLTSQSLGKDPNDNANLYLQIKVKLYQIFISKDKKKSWKEIYTNVTIGQVQDLLNGVMWIDINTIPVHRIGPK